MKVQTGNPFAIVQTKTLASLVQEDILQSMREGALVSGSKLVENTFTSRLAVSRAAVREAFRAMEEAGLLRQEKNRGVFVREFTRKEAIELYEIRGWLEEMVARQVTSTISDENLMDLTRINTRLEALAARGALNQYIPLNVAFHDTFMLLAGNETLMTMYRRLSDQMHLLRRLGYEVKIGLAASNTEHKKILEGLAKRDAGTVAAAIRAHAVAGLTRMLAS